MFNDKNSFYEFLQLNDRVHIAKGGHKFIEDVVLRKKFSILSKLKEDLTSKVNKEMDFKK
jgi:hypothetical protein